MTIVLFVVALYAVFLMWASLSYYVEKRVLEPYFVKQDKLRYEQYLRTRR